MKHTAFIPMIVAGSLALAAPVYAAEDTPAAEAEVAANSVAVSTVLVKGGGWGVERRVSSALKTQDGVTKVLTSGFRAFVFLEEGKSLDEAKVKEALTKGRLQLASISQESIITPDHAYVITATGTGWAGSCDKVRLALEERDDVAVAFVGRTITLLPAEGKELDEKEITTALASHKVKVTGFTKSKELPL